MKKINIEQIIKDGGATLNKADALRIGKERGQISVYAWSAGACLYC